MTSSTTGQPADRPLIGVGVIVWRGNKVLLIKRGKEPKKGQWSIPGGAQERGETLHEAARREVREETGLDVEIAGLVDVVDGLMRDAGGTLTHHYTLIDFVARSSTGDPVAGDDALEAAWFGIDELSGLQLAQDTLRVIDKSRATPPD